jgi:hypothetical protein
MLIGEDHIEQQAFPATVPVITDCFDEENGEWLRGYLRAMATLCSSCLSDRGEGRFIETVRFDLVPPDVRAERVAAWTEATGKRPPGRRHVGGFRRVKTLPEVVRRGYVLALE